MLVMANIKKSVGGELVLSVVEMTINSTLTDIEAVLSEEPFSFEESSECSVLARLQAIKTCLEADRNARSMLVASSRPAPAPEMLVSSPAPATEMLVSSLAPAPAPAFLQHCGFKDADEERNATKMLSHPFKSKGADKFYEGENAHSVIATSENPPPCFSSYFILNPIYSIGSFFSKQYCFTAIRQYGVSRRTFCYQCVQTLVKLDRRRGVGGNET